MLSIVLLILKIIGIILASILGLLLFLLLVILFVPIRYRIEGRKRSELVAKARLSWLCRIVYLKFDYKDNKPMYTLRIFGYLVLSDKPKKRRSKKKRTSKKKKTFLSTRAKSKQQSERPKEVKQLESNLGQETCDNKEKNNTPVPALEKTEKKKSIFFKLKEMFGVIPEKVRGIKQKIRDILTLLKELLRKLGVVKAFFIKKETQVGFLKILGTVKRLLKYIHPKKLSFKIHFGTGDPCSTGQALSVVCVVCPQLLNTVQIIPNFEEKILEADLYARGHIRIITLIVIAIRLIIDKEFKDVLHEIKNLKEELENGR